MRKAESNLRLARLAAAVPNPERDAACFHCQQAAEKYLKAILCERRHRIHRTHDLGSLLSDLVPHEPSLKPLRRMLESLSQYAVEYRYPDFSASARQMRAALRHAERVRLQARTILRLPP